MESRSLGALVLALTTLVCCGGIPRTEANGEATLVRAVAQGIIAADNARDITRVLDFYAEDAVLLPPNDAPVRGKRAIRPRYESLFRDFTPEIIGTIDEVHVGADWAFVIGTNRGRLLPIAGGEPRSLSDAYVMILRRTPEGRWRIGRLMWHPVTVERVRER